MSTDNTPSTPGNMREVLDFLMGQSISMSRESQSRKDHDLPVTEAMVKELQSAFPTRKIEVCIQYSGSGDDGWFSDISIRFVEGDKVSADWPSPEESERVRAIIEKHGSGKVYEEMYPILEARAPGWEINEGSSGQFVFKPDGSRIHQHDENIHEINSSEWEF
jgi:hypothetical protein